MPTYIFVCPTCATRIQRVQSGVPAAPLCSNCNSEMRRDWKTEGAAHTFHPTIDLYGNDVKRRAQKKKDERYF